MQSQLFYGSGVAMVTPFRGRRVDYDALENLIDWQIDADTDALVILGTTGEPSTIAPDARSAIVECALSRCARRVPLIVGTGANDTRTAIRQSVEAQRLGADALLVVTPYYNRSSRRGLIEHYTAIADQVEIPVILYNDSLAAAVGSNRSMVEDGEMPNVASWYVNGTFLSAWYSAVDAEELPASAAAFVEMSRNAAFQSGTAAEGGAAMAAMG